jgi:hypothetical protein
MDIYIYFIVRLIIYFTVIIALVLIFIGLDQGYKSLVIAVIFIILVTCEPIRNAIFYYIFDYSYIKEQVLILIEQRGN